MPSPRGKAPDASAKASRSQRRPLPPPRRRRKEALREYNALLAAAEMEAAPLKPEHRVMIEEKLALAAVEESQLSDAPLPSPTSLRSTGEAFSRTASPAPAAGAAATPTATAPVAARMPPAMLPADDPSECAQQVRAYPGVAAAANGTEAAETTLRPARHPPTPKPATPPPAAAATRRYEHDYGARGVARVSSMPRESWPRAVGNVEDFRFDRAEPGTCGGPHP